MCGPAISGRRSPPHAATQRRPAQEQSRTDPLVRAGPPGPALHSASLNPRYTDGPSAADQRVRPTVAAPLATKPSDRDNLCPEAPHRRWLACAPVPDRDNPPCLNSAQRSLGGTVRGRHRSGRVASHTSCAASGLRVPPDLRAAASAPPEPGQNAAREGESVVPPRAATPTRTRPSLGLTAQCSPSPPPAVAANLSTARPPLAPPARAPDLAPGAAVRPKHRAARERCL